MFWIKITAFNEIETFRSKSFPVVISGRWTKGDLRPWIRFNHVVRQVTFNDATNDFSVVVKNLPEDKVLPVERFDYIIVAVGHFSAPNVPHFPGMDQFPGRVIHSHDFRDASQFKDKRVLVVGSSYSAEDIALQCLKYGAKNIICTWENKTDGFQVALSGVREATFDQDRGKNCPVWRWNVSRSRRHYSVHWIPLLLSIPGRTSLPQNV